MALSFIDYDYDTIARPFIYGIARVHLQEIENLANSNADFLKKRRKSFLQEMFVSSGIHFVVVRRITFTKKIYHSKTLLSSCFVRGM